MCVIYENDMGKYVSQYTFAHAQYFYLYICVSSLLVWRHYSVYSVAEGSQNVRLFIHCLSLINGMTFCRFVFLSGGDHVNVLSNQIGIEEL